MGSDLHPVFPELLPLALVYPMTCEGDSAFTSSLSRTPISLSRVLFGPQSPRFFLRLIPFTSSPPFAFFFF